MRYVSGRGALLVAAIIVLGLGSGVPATAASQAQKACTRSCRQALGSCLAMARAARQQDVAVCTDTQCRRQAKQAFRAARTGCRGTSKACRRCCRRGGCPSSTTTTTAGTSSTTTTLPLAVRRFCSEFEFGDTPEPDADSREFAVTAVDALGEVVAGTALPPIDADVAGCADVGLWPDVVNRVRVSGPSSPQAGLLRYVRGPAAGSPPGATLMINVPVDVASAYLDRLFVLGAYDVSGASSSLDAFYDGALVCTDLGNAWDDGTITVAGIDGLVRCLASDAAPLHPLARAGGGICTPAVLFANGLDTQGGYVGGTDLGNDLGAAVFEAEDASDCLLSAFDGAAVAHTVTVFGDAMDAVGDEATACRHAAFDNDRLDGVSGEKTLDTNRRALWGYTQLAVGNDVDDPDHHFLTAGIFHLGGEALDSSDGDVELGAGDLQSVDFGATLAAYHLIDLSNNDGVVPLLVDSDTEWMIFSASQSLRDGNGDGRADSDSVWDALDDVSDRLLVIQECNPSRSVEFVAADGSSTVVQAINDSLIVTPEDEAEKRLFPAFMLAIVIDTTTAEGILHFDDLERAALAGAQGTVGSYLANRADDPTPLEVARMIARSRTLCDPAVVGLGGGDDIVIGGLPVVRPNCAVAGLHPREEFAVLGCSGDDLEAHRADMFGLASFTCVNRDGTSPNQVTVDSRGVQSTIAIGP